MTPELEQKYSPLHELGSLAQNGTPSIATDLNDQGDIVGITALPNSRVTHAFIVSPRINDGRMTDITPSEMRSSVAEAVNEYGVVVGTLGVGITNDLMPPGIVDEIVEPFIWSSETGLEILPLPPGSPMGQAVDINDSGIVLVTGARPGGDALPRGLPTGSFLWNPATRSYTQLPVPTPTSAEIIPLGHAIDQQSRVSGGLVTLAGEQNWQHSPIIWEPGSFIPLKLAGNDSFVNSYADGLAVGWQMTTPGKPPIAVYWPDVKDLPVELPGRAALKANNQGHIVGIREFSEFSGFPFSAVLWEPKLDRTTEMAHLGMGSYVLGLSPSGRSSGYVVAMNGDSPVARAAWWDSPSQ